MPPLPRHVLTWIGLAALSFLLAWGLNAASVPAAILMGPMIAAIGVGLAGSPVRVSRALFSSAQGVVGCLLAGSVTPEVVAEVVRDWPEMLFGVSSTVAASTSVGLALARFGTLPGSTAAWGTSAGAASVMAALAHEHGADPRLVATMQYVRVIIVVIAASLISRLLIDTPLAPVAARKVPALSPVFVLGVAAALAIALGGSWLGRRLRIPAGSLLVPLGIGALVNALTPVHLAVPASLLAAAYALIGWAIGLQFERGSLIRSMRALPEMMGSALAIVALCGLAAWVMVVLGGIAPLTAFLATSPGGIDTVAIIALAGGADTPFVMALQVLRVLVVILTGPPIARFVARHTRPG
ncbi:AbrB family transcriptional regulator [Enterovirga sp.]|uniref:AbrB family transcriptional regulator n=1 Tax=Enterovirga sp. TaxID=2026350 RepID=UPI002BC402FA|nr:AbrB family transcriptional regulator [Enterovirga sp.]HMO29581.1 AbrB family transcriptional regulator [Enterovirga sp.]